MRKRLFVLVHSRKAQWFGSGFALLLALATSIAAGGTSAPASAQLPSTHASGVSPSRAAALKSDATRPLWVELTSAQQLALKPLSASWNALSEGRKRKWLALSKNYPNMSSAEKVKLQERMSEWVTLSAQQRNQARLNYAQSKAISPTEKQEKWQAYQALSPEEKHKLAVKVPPPPKGAAPAVKPDSSANFTVVPTSPKSVKPGQKIATATHKIDQKTLLPHPEKALTASAPASAAAPAPVTAATPSAVAPALTSTD
jgi:hypothetical protein